MSALYSTSPVVVVGEAGPSPIPGWTAEYVSYMQDCYRCGWSLHWRRSPQLHREELRTRSMLSTPQLASNTHTHIHRSPSMTPKANPLP